MTDTFLVFGDWRMRHHEPAAAGGDVLSLRAPADDTNRSDHSLLLDLRRPLREVWRVDPLGVHAAAESAHTNPGHNLAADELPLALVTLQHGWAQITHLLTRIEKQVTHLIRPPVEPPPCLLEDLPHALREAFETNHLSLNNFECYYQKGMPDTELEQKFNIAGAYDYHVVNRRWFEALDNRQVRGFAPQLGDEIQHWSYDNDFARILPNGQNLGGYLSIMHWSRARKVRWDDPVVTLKKKLYHEDSLARWERNYPNQRVVRDPEHTLQTYFQLPIAMLPAWRRTRFDMACEALATGNIFMINFEDSRVRDDGSDAGRLQQCEIEYLKTRGQPQEELIYEDLESLSQAVERFLEAQGLRCERTNYSKLSFLEDYVQQRAGAALADTREDGA